MNDILKEIYSLDYHKYNNRTAFNYATVGSEGYGETGYESFKLIMDSYEAYFNDDTVFYDLGSGLGKLVFHVGMMSNAKKSCGIEYSKERYNVSIDYLNKYPKENIMFINDSFLNVDLSDATVIYTDNTLFPTNIDNAIYDKIPKDCIVFSRKQFKQSRINDELIKQTISPLTQYGTSSLYIMIKK